MRNDYKRFCYPIEPVLRVRRWDMDTAKAEEVQAGRVLSARGDEARQLGASIAALETLLRAAYQRGAAIDMDWQRGLTAFLASQRRDFQDKLEELRQAQHAHDAARRALLEAKQKLTVLEKDKEDKQQEHLQAHIRQEQKHSDDLWLLRLGRTERGGGRFK